MILHSASRALQSSVLRCRVIVLASTLCYSKCCNTLSLIDTVERPLADRHENSLFFYYLKGEKNYVFFFPKSVAIVLILNYKSMIDP